MTKQLCLVRRKNHVTVGTVEDLKPRLGDTVELLLSDDISKAVTESYEWLERTLPFDVDDIQAEMPHRATFHAWMNKNTTGRYSRYTGTMRFENERDAFVFKMHWC